MQFRSSTPSLPKSCVAEWQYMQTWSHDLMGWVISPLSSSPSCSPSAPLPHHCGVGQLSPLHPHRYIYLPSSSLHYIHSEPIVRQVLHMYCERTQSNISMHLTWGVIMFSDYHKPRLLLCRGRGGERARNCTGINPNFFLLIKCQYWMLNVISKNNNQVKHDRFQIKDTVFW